MGMVPEFLRKKNVRTEVQTELTLPAVIIRITENYMFDGNKETFTKESPFTSLIDASDYYLSSVNFLTVKVQRFESMNSATIEWLDFERSTHEVITVTHESRYDGINY